MQERPEQAGWVHVAFPLLPGAPVAMPAWSAALARQCGGWRRRCSGLVLTEEAPEQCRVGAVHDGHPAPGLGCECSVILADPPRSTVHVDVG